MNSAGDIDGVTVNVDAEADISVNLDANDDSRLGGDDHEVLIYGTTKTSINVADRFIFDLGLQAAGIMHWKVESANVYQVHAMASAGLGLGFDGLQEAIPGNTTYGNLFNKLVDGFGLGASADVGFIVQVCTGSFYI